MAQDLEEIVDDLATSLGTDASFFRVEKDRLYLTGIEIATGIAVGLISSYLLGLYNGAKKGLAKEGEKNGEAIVDAVITKLKEIISRIIDARKKTNPVEEINIAQQDLYTIQISEIILLKSYAKDLELTSEIKIFMAEIGYPTDIIKNRAESIVKKIEKDLDN